jgi:hypothetical protein
MTEPNITVMTQPTPMQVSRVIVIKTQRLIAGWL